MNIDFTPIVRLVLIGLGALAGIVLMVIMGVISLYYAPLAGYLWVPIVLGMTAGALWPIDD